MRKAWRHCRGNRRRQGCFNWMPHHGTTSRLGPKLCIEKCALMLREVLLHAAVGKTHLNEGCSCICPSQGRRYFLICSACFLGAQAGRPRHVLARCLRRRPHVVNLRQRPAHRSRPAVQILSSQPHTSTDRECIAAAPRVDGMERAHTQRALASVDHAPRTSVLKEKVKP